MNRFVFGLRFTLFVLLLSINYSSSSESVDCHTNLTSIALAEIDWNDTSVPRTYILCPKTTFDAATMKSDGTFPDNYPLFVRSNALVLCGQDGSSDNSCVINGNGQFGVFIDPTYLVMNETFVENVTIQGVTVDFFSSSSSDYFDIPISVGLESGDVTFKDCIFSNNFGVPVFQFNQYVSSSRRLRSDEDSTSIKRKLKSDAKITFDSCKFDSNQGSEDPNDNSISFLTFFGLDSSGYLLPTTVDVYMVNNIFTDNIQSFENDQAIYRNFVDFYSTGKLTMKNNCFINSDLSLMGNSSIVMTMEESVVIFDNNYRDGTPADLECPDILQYVNELADYVCQTSVTFNATECPVKSSSTTTSTPASLPSTTTTTTAPTSVTTDTAVPATTPSTIPSPTTSSPPSGSTTIPMWTAENLVMSILFIFVMEMF